MYVDFVPGYINWVTDLMGMGYVLILFDFFYHPLFPVYEDYLDRLTIIQIKFKIDFCLVLLDYSCNLFCVQLCRFSPIDMRDILIKCASEGIYYFYDFGCM